MQKLLALSLALLCVLSLCACYAAPSSTQTPAPAAAASAAPVAASAAPVSSDGAETPAPDSSAAPVYVRKDAQPISAWAVYWDTADLLNELAARADALTALSYFEAYFSPDGTLLLPDKLPGLFASVEAAYPDNAWDSYISVVNDVLEADGSFSQKTKDILWHLFADDVSIDAHVEAVIAVALQYGFDGIEIDYEAFDDDSSLWEPFTVFCTRLYERAQEEGLGLRIVLEPYAPFDAYDFPVGPAYVIMCYNLHGGHSAPGPKADIYFLADVAARASVLPGKVDYALAMGGYDWPADGDAVQVRERDAAALYADYGTGACTRDEESGALSFRYKDEDGKRHTVWYADKETLKLWENTLRAMGAERFSYWRLGGNVL